MQHMIFWINKCRTILYLYRHWFDKFGDQPYPVVIFLRQGLMASHLWTQSFDTQSASLVNIYNVNLGVDI